MDNENMRQNDQMENRLPAEEPLAEAQNDSAELPEAVTPAEPEATAEQSNTVLPQGNYQAPPYGDVNYSQQYVPPQYTQQQPMQGSSEYYNRYAQQTPQQGAPQPQYYQPYQEPPRPAPVKPTIKFRDLSGMMRWMIVTGVVFVVSTLCFVFSLNGYVASIVGGSLDVSMSVLYMVGSLFMSVSASAFTVFTLLFVYRANQNLSFIGCPVKKYSPGWALAWFIIPLANWVMVFPVMKEIWESSQPGYYNWTADGSPAPEKPSSAPVLFWFLMRILCSVAGIILSISSMAVSLASIGSASYDAAMQGLQGTMTGSAITMGIALISEMVFLVIAKMIADRQKQKFEASQAFYSSQKAQGGE